MRTRILDGILERIAVQRGTKPRFVLERTGDEWSLPGKWPVRDVELKQWLDALSTLRSRFAALPIDAVARSDGVMPSANCWHYRPSMPIGWRLFPTACRPVQPPRRLKPLLSSTSPTWRVSNCRAATAAIDANEKRDAVSFVGKKSRAEMQRYGRDYLTGAAAS